MIFHHARRLARGFAAAASALAVGLAGAGAAEVPPTATIESCTSCHGPGGVSLGAIPSIAGQDVAELDAALRAYRDGSRAGSIMGRLVGPLSDAEIVEISAYFASMPEAAQ